MSGYADGYWWSNDNLRLHYRDYAGRDAGKNDGRPPILCMPGLTRNARDYANLARRLAGEWRVIAIEFRGRGESAYAKDSMSYVPLTYVQDIDRLIAELAIDRFVAFGTSLGGIVAMLLAGMHSERLAGVLLNDVGPEIDPAGLARIRGYVGRGGAWPTWVHAARALAESQGTAYPRYALTDWLAMAKRLNRLTSGGRIVPDYDMKIADPFRLPGGEAGVDLWPAFDALKSSPLAVVRGAISDVLSAATLARMAERIPHLHAATVPDTGHAPTLDEPEAIAAIESLLREVR